jgi:hypothetical protein
LKEQGQPKLSLAMDSAWRCRHKACRHPHTSLLPRCEEERHRRRLRQLWIRPPLYLPGRSYRKLNLLLGETRPPSHSSPATMAAGGGRERGRWGSQRREGSRRASRHRGKAIHARAIAVANSMLC